jgi:hypothetical protein
MSDSRMQSNSSCHWAHTLLKGQISFKDLHGHEQDGAIQFSMLGQDALKFVGYKIGQAGANADKPWKSYLLDNIRYEDAWNKL